jgi:hypothetical protein
VCATLPPIVGDENYVPRSKEEVAKRTLNILTAAVFGELFQSEGLESARETVRSIMDQYGTEPLLSPGERAFVFSPDPARQEALDFAWRYECAWVGLWALGFVDDLSYPDGICDVSGMADIVRACGSFPAFAARASLRSPGEILDQADIIYRYDWACVDARINGRDAPAGLMPGVVMERHRMLNWLTRYMDADWDDVSTDT